VSEPVEDCPVSEKLCAAYRQIQDEKIAGILKAIYSTGATITILVTVAEILLRVWRF
jgi:hypothetical protein